MAQRPLPTMIGVKKVVVIAAVGVLAAIAPANASTGAKTFQAPFKVGSTGGDSFSYHSASSDGTVTLARAYPIPGAINCTKGGPWGMLYVQDKATKPIRKVVVSYDSAAVDNFTFVLVSLRDPQHKRWYGTKTLRGFVAGSGSVTLVPDHQDGKFPRTLTVQFGLQQSSACPNADAGTIHFTKVQVFS